jgi:hypothetical protein
MKKLLLTLAISASTLSFATEDSGTDFFSSSNSSSSIGVVDDPDPAPTAPISDYILPLMGAATVLGFYYTRKKVITK